MREVCMHQHCCKQSPNLSIAHGRLYEAGGFNRVFNKRLRYKNNDNVGGQSEGVTTYILVFKPIRKTSGARITHGVFLSVVTGTCVPPDPFSQPDRTKNEKDVVIDKGPVLETNRQQDTQSRECGADQDGVACFPDL